MATRLAVLLTGFLLLSCAGIADNQARDADTFDLREIRCEELTVLPEEEQGYLLVLIFGYAAGDNNSPIQTSLSIESQISGAYRRCESEPESTVLDAMVSAASGS